MGVWEKKTLPHAHTPTQHDTLKATLNFTDLGTAQ